MTASTQAGGSGDGLGVATSESPLFVELVAEEPPHGQALYLRVAMETPHTAARYPPRVRVVLVPDMETFAAGFDDDDLIGAMSIFPWPRRATEPIRASFNLSGAVKRLAGRLGVTQETLYSGLRIAVQVLPDPRDPQPARVHVTSVELTRASHQQ